MVGQGVMVVVLGTLAYLDVNLKWIVLAGFFVSVGTIIGLLEKWQADWRQAAPS